MQLTVRFSHSRRLELAGTLGEHLELRRTATKLDQDLNRATGPTRRAKSPLQALDTEKEMDRLAASGPVVAGLARETGGAQRRAP